MSESEAKREKQKKNLLKIVDKLHVPDLKDICGTFKISKYGAKAALKQKIVDLIESDKDFPKVRKEIRKTYKANDKIKKSPKKGKKKKKKKNLKKDNKFHISNFLPDCLEDRRNSSSASESGFSNVPRISVPSRPSVPLQRQIYEPIEHPVNSNNDFLDLNIFDNFDNFQPTDSSDESDDEWQTPNQSLVNKVSASEESQTSFASTVNNALSAVNQPFRFGQTQSTMTAAAQRSAMPLPPPLARPGHGLIRPPVMQADPTRQSTSQSNSGHIGNYFSNIRFPNVFSSRAPDYSQPRTMQEQLHHNPMVFHPPVRPPVRPQPYMSDMFAQRFSSSSNNPLDFSMRHPFYPNNNSGHPNAQPFHQSYNNPNYYYPNQSNPVSEQLDLNLETLIEQQKILLSQYPNSFQESEPNSCESDCGVAEEFVFKALPKYKVIKTLSATKTIGSLSDIGTQTEFFINLWDLDPIDPIAQDLIDSLSQKQQLNHILRTKSMKIILRFGYMSDVTIKEHKDSIPAHLCIDCNERRLYCYDDRKENDVLTAFPFDLSADCCLGRNKIKFSMSKPNYTYLMPCIYEISLVEDFTPDRFYEKLKNDGNQFLPAEYTKRMIKSRYDQTPQDDNICVVNSDIKLNLICPVSCQRIVVPIRTMDCKHIECFDAYSFLKTNEWRYDWLCPICQTSASFDKLMIDGYLKDILSSTESTDSTEVFIKSDASYDIKQSKTLSEEVIELDDSTIDSDIDVENEISEVSVVDSEGCIVLD